jgi:hypothetical protein
MSKGLFVAMHPKDFSRAMVRVWRRAAARERAVARGVRALEAVCGGVCRDRRREALGRWVAVTVGSREAAAREASVRAEREVAAVREQEAAAEGVSKCG